VLFGSSKAHRQVREELVNKHRLQAVISMPGGVFKPYAGVSTGVLIFTKTGSGGTDNVWFYDMKGDGYTLDDKRQPDEKNNDIPDIVNRWQHPEQEAANTRTHKSFFVPVAEIRANNYDLSINRYKETVYEEKTYAAPAEIIREIESLDAERAVLLNELKGMLV
jgi:type I restriction enzyme M protein